MFSAFSVSSVSSAFSAFSAFSALKGVNAEDAEDTEDTEKTDSFTAYLISRASWPSLVRSALTSSSDNAAISSINAASSAALPCSSW